jgi:glucose/arabinose dehydrogenase
MSRAVNTRPWRGCTYLNPKQLSIARIGRNLAPDYVTLVKPGGFYGWPWYYVGGHEDTRPGGGPRPDLKDKVPVPDVLLQPHSAPLCLAFNEGSQIPCQLER